MRCDVKANFCVLNTILKFINAQIYNNFSIFFWEGCQSGAGVGRAEVAENMLLNNSSGAVLQFAPNNFCLFNTVVQLFYIYVNIYPLK